MKENSTIMCNTLYCRRNSDDKTCVAYGSFGAQDGTVCATGKVNLYIK